MNQPVPANPKQILAELIDTFAAAKASGNTTLQQLAALPIQEFLNTHDIYPSEAAPVTEDN